MPENIRSLIVVLCIAITIFALTKKTYVEIGISEKSFNIRRNSWILITLALFLSGDFWVFLSLAALVVHIGSKRDDNIAAYIVSIIFAAPLIDSEIGGLGIVNFLIAIDYYRAIAIVVMLPLFFRLMKSKDVQTIGQIWPDRYLIVFILASLSTQVIIDSPTNTMRTAFYYLIDIFLPYYVCSRYIKTLASLREVVAAFILSALVIGSIGVFESAKGWLLYSSVPEALDMVWGYGKYLNRGSDLRAIASTAQPIVLGFILQIAVGLNLYMHAYYRRNIFKYASLAILLLGLIAPISRRPWLGALFALMIYVATGVNPVRKTAKIILYVIACFSLSLSTPMGEKIVGLIPFVGNVDNENVVYRQRLLDAAWQVFQQNPIFGSYSFRQTPEIQALKWGTEDGVVDLVNTYLGIALSRGMVGIGLFIAFFCAILLGIFKKIWSNEILDPEEHLMGRAIFSTLCGIMLTIYTVSSISFIPIVYWIIAGLGVAYVAKK